MDEFKKEYIYQKYKDSHFINKKEFDEILKKIKINLTYKESTTLYVKIINYQVKKYGSSLKDSKYGSYGVAR